MSDYYTAKEIVRYYYTLGILSDISRYVDDYRTEKNVMLIADTTELLHKVIGDSSTPFIYEKTGTRIDHYMIDEFQDTSRMQWENFRPLIEESLAASFDNLIVGDVKQVDGSLLGDLIGRGIVPVMAPLTHDGEGHILNTNADTIAGETAKGLAGRFDVTLVFCFEKKGVLRDENDNDSVIPLITPADFHQYVADGTIQGGMIPKLENAFEALRAGVSEVIITSAAAIGHEGGTRILGNSIQ